MLRANSATDAAVVYAPGIRIDGSPTSGTSGATFGGGLGGSELVHAWRDPVRRASLATVGIAQATGWSAFIEGSLSTAKCVNALRKGYLTPRQAVVEVLHNTAIAALSALAGASVGSAAALLPVGAASASLAAGFAGAGTAYNVNRALHDALARHHAQTVQWV